MTGYLRDTFTTQICTQVHISFFLQHKFLHRYTLITSTAQIFTQVHKITKGKTKLKKTRRGYAQIKIYAMKFPRKS